MAKFVKLENGTWINVNQIIQIGSAEGFDGEMFWRISTTEIASNMSNSSSVRLEVTQQDVDNILKASESKNDSGGEKKISKETLKIAINAMKNESADLGSQAGFALETDAPGAESYYRDCEEQDAILREAIDELEEYGGVHFGGVGSKLDKELKERGLQ